jgi:ketosteroid isomerase-like protein
MGSVRESTFDVLDPEVVVLGPGAAVISFQWSETTVDAGGTVAQQEGAITLVFQRRAGEWLVVRAHESFSAAQ